MPRRADSTERDDATGEEIQDTAVPIKNEEALDGSKRAADAFAALMSKKARPQASPPLRRERTMCNPASRPFAGRDGLGAYISHPTAFSSSQVISHNEHAVLINDLYPKSTVHALLLPRHPERSLQHPFDAFADASFLATVRSEAERARLIVASELQRRFGSDSVSDRARNRALSAVKVPSELPTGRDWAAEVRIGVHAHPSMAHLHVHVFSPDMVSGCMRHRKHYLTFNTPFLVPLEAFPLPEGSPFTRPGREGYLDRELECWRCGMGFGNKFARLKQHLEEELEVWKRL